MTFCKKAFSKGFSQSNSSANFYAKNQIKTLAFVIRFLTFSSYVFFMFINFYLNFFKKGGVCLGQIKEFV